MDLYEKTIEYVDQSFGGKKSHFEWTVFWLEKFLPDATSAHRIAAYAHDIERGIKGEKDRDYLDPEILERHQKDGAEIMAGFLKDNGADEATVEKVKYLIGGHERGGDAEQNALMDADSVSYFETNARHFVEERTAVDGYEKIKAKLDWMFDRISTDERKAFARENYDHWLKASESYRHRVRSAG